MKTKEQINEYIKSKKGSSVSLFKRKSKDYISFRDKKGRFTGWIQKTKDSENAVKKYLPVKTIIKVKIKGERGRKTFTYNVYNKEQQRKVLYRMNRRLRTKEPDKYKDDAVPFVKGKKKVDLLFDKYKFKPVKIEKYEGES